MDGDGGKQLYFWAGAAGNGELFFFPCIYVLASVIFPPYLHAFSSPYCRPAFAPGCIHCFFLGHGLPTLPKG